MKNKLCIVVPYRDRAAHLAEFKPRMEEYLKSQGVDFTILVVEQEIGKPFNRAKLLNVGFDYAEKNGEYTYYCFHDVDMLPIESDYEYCGTPTHLAAKAEQFGYRLPYDKYFGGVTIFDRESFLKINGYSNEYWGWGAEDDDVYNRCVVMGINPRRKEGSYRSLAHDRVIQQEEYRKNVSRLQSFMNYYDGHKFTEGLTTLDYVLKNEDREDEFIKITVEI